MSKFFQVPEDDTSDLSSSEEESLYGSSSEEHSASDASEDLSDDNESDQDDGDSDASEDEDTPRGLYMRNQFLKGQGDSGSDSDDEKIVVKSAKAKLLDEISTESALLEQLVDKEDWVKALTSFDKLVKVADRANKQYETIPEVYINALDSVESALASSDGKKLSPSMSKAQNTLRQRLKKTKKEVEAREAVFKLAAEQKKIDEDSAAARRGSPLVTYGSRAGTEEPVELTAATVFQTLLSVMESRGRKSTDRNEQVLLLERQLVVANTAYQKISLLLMLIPLRFDLSTSNQSTSASNNYSMLHHGADFGPWEQIEADICQLFEVLEANPEYIVVESAPEPEDIVAGPAVSSNGKREIPGSLPTLVERLDDEHARILATYDPHTTEYLEKLRDETRLAALILRAQCHQEQNMGVKITKSESFCRLLSRRIDHIYYKPAAAVTVTETEAWKRVPVKLNTSVAPRPSAEGISAVTGEPITPIVLISELCQVLYRQSNTLLRARAMLSLIYQYALSDDYYKARDLLLMSHLQSQIHIAEPATQVLFNRALVQVGLCAFRAGLISDALQSLQEICGSSRLKELLGQGQPRQDFNAAANSAAQAAALAGGSANTPELLPYHMHINLELVECVYLTASMLTEVPYLANIANSRAAQLDLKKRSQNRPFRRMLEQHDRQVFSGPSETTRDYVIQAAKRLQTGAWKSAFELLSHIKVWNLLSPSSDATQRVLTMLEHKLKIEGLRTYLLAYGSQAYHSVSLEFMQEEFQLSEAATRQVVVKMIAGDEVSALLDSSSNYLVFKPEADVSRLQTLALALVDKAGQLAERNERLAADGHIPEQTTKRPMRAR